MWMEARHAAWFQAILFASIDIVKNACWIIFVEHAGSWELAYVKSAWMEINVSRPNSHNPDVLCVRCFCQSTDI